MSRYVASEFSADRAASLGAPPANRMMIELCVYVSYRLGMLWEQCLADSSLIFETLSRAC
jgi:hypothetical protein